MKNKHKEIAKIVLYALVFGHVLPDDVKMKKVRRLAIKITNNITNSQ